MSQSDLLDQDLLDDAAPLGDVLTWSEWALARVGFRPSNCLPLVAACRDELMAEVDEAVTSTWGRPFQIGSLAGLVFLGRTGVGAALSHAPGEDGRHRFVAFCVSHIGVDEDGTVGRVQRRGRHRASGACGALLAYRQHLLAGGGEQGIDGDDVEQSLLRQRLGGMVVGARVPSLVGLTDLARQAAVADLHRYLDLARGDEPVDVAYISGIVVHLPDGDDVVSGVRAHVEIDGQVIPLPR